VGIARHFLEPVAQASRLCIMFDILLVKRAPVHAYILFFHWKYLWQ
jgi:hypothetical protein